MEDFELPPYANRLMKSAEKILQSSYLSIEEKKELEKSVMKTYED